MLNVNRKIIVVIFVLALILTLFSTFVFAAPILTSSISATPIVQPNETITVVMTVTNTGDQTANNVLPSTLTIGGTGTVTGPLTGPPFTPVTLAAGGSTTFSWTYTAGPIGADKYRDVNFTGNASGTYGASSTVSSSPSTSNNVVIGYCDYTECYTVPFGAERNLNLNEAFKYCFPTASSGGITIFLGPFYGTATLQPAGQQIRYISTNRAACDEGPDWIIFKATDNQGNTRGYFKICIGVDCSALPIANPDTATVCSSSYVDIYVLGNDINYGTSPVLAVLDPPLFGSTQIFNNGTTGAYIRYTAPTSSGTYDFNYTVTNGIYPSNAATVTVVVKKTPVAVDDSPAAICSNAPPLDIAVLSNDANY
ncbi:MAG: Ig-like domain-containing protein, partial [Candidatus Methanofastidiosum sp.]|nr:Ig-like domain-containing protein [Methanofastidiosum sp.]